MAPGEGIYVFTDGVTEAANPQGDMFGEDRLQAVLQGAVGRGSAEIVKSVTAAIRRFIGPALPSDDVTMLAICRLDPSVL